VILIKENYFKIHHLRVLCLFTTLFQLFTILQHLHFIGRALMLIEIEINFNELVIIGSMFSEFIVNV